MEVIRCCTDGTKNAASKLYAAAWHAARAMGYRRLVTYTLIEEPGTSLRAAGWKRLFIKHEAVVGIVRLGRELISIQQVKRRFGSLWLNDGQD
uniref:XF1762 family protein n=1 Tax=Paenibacillus foliorum TaxID=2654974 RepID=UPI001C105F40|nr:XF1762 family protein [Paenibacillus foliorum]